MHNLWRLSDIQQRRRALVCGLAVVVSCWLDGPRSARAQAQPQVPKPPDCIYVMNSDGSGAREFLELDDYPNLGSLAVSPDGRNVAFDAWGEGESSRHGRVFVTDRGQTRRSELPGCLMPTFSTDGKSVAVSRNSPNTGCWVMAIDGSRSFQLSRGWGAQWSPDGTAVAYASGRQIMLYELATDTERVLLPPEAHPYTRIYWNMAWSPESDRLCFLGVEDGNRVIATLSIGDPIKSHKRRFAGEKTRIWADFAWHPGGDRVVFSMFDPEIKRHQLYEFNPDTDDEPTYFEGQPPERSNQDMAWTPDGKELFFISK